MIMEIIKSIEGKEYIKVEQELCRIEVVTTTIEVPMNTLFKRKHQLTTND